jgi:serine/threonine-protein kinase
VIIGGVVLLLAIGAVVWFLLRGGGNVPDVRGKQQNEAAQILIGAGFSMGSTEVVSTEPPGTVISQNPAAGSRAEKGSTVSVEVARKADVPVPNVIGQPREVAVQTLTQAGFTVSVQEIPSFAAPGTVIGVTPPVGTPMRPGSGVTLQIATLLIGVSPALPSLPISPGGL